jgi:SOS-response transcriptional repressor LexA
MIMESKHDPQAVYAFIVQYKFAHDGNSPTVREIMENCHISSKSVASSQLQKLEHDGKIRLGIQSKRARSICVVGGQWRLSNESTSYS